MTKLAMISGTVGGYATFGAPGQTDLGWSMLLLSAMLLLLGLVRGRQQALRIPTVAD